MRNLHLYLGLIVSPFVIVFALSAILLNHPSAPVNQRGTVTETSVRVPEGIAGLEGMPRVQALQGVLAQIGVSGEIGWVSVDRKLNTMTVPLTRPGIETTVRLDLDRQRAFIETKRRGFAEALHWLHKMPGPHLVNIRGNWVYTRIWRWLADASVYLLLLITLTGVYLWAVLRSERQVGLVLLAAGALGLMGMVYALAA